MFEVKLIRGSDTLVVKTCGVGDLLPTIAALLQRYEGNQGQYEYQRSYAIQWRRIKE